MSVLVPVVVHAEELSFAEKMKVEGRARADARRAEQEAFNAKLATLGGVEGQISTPGGSSAVEVLKDASPIKMKRAPDRRGEGLPEPGIGEMLNLPEIKFELKRPPGSEESSDGNFIKFKR